MCDNWCMNDSTAVVLGKSISVYICIKQRVDTESLKFVCRFVQKLDPGTKSVQ